MRRFVGAPLTLTSRRRAHSREVDAKIRRREPDLGAENTSKCISAVDNAMTPM
jgi:hypothetical protein